MFSFNARQRLYFMLMLIFSPLEFFENENFEARVPKIWIWTSKIMPDLKLSAVFCQIKKESLHPK